MSGIRLTKIAKNSEQISHFIDPASLTDRVGFQKTPFFQTSRSLRPVGNI